MSNQELGSVILVHDVEAHPFGTARPFEVASYGEAVLGRIVAVSDERMPGNVVEYNRGGVNCDVRFAMNPGEGPKCLEDYDWTVGAVARALGL